ncbi:phage tail domain-containing protein [Bacillus mesophilum]|uniref:Phage tail family protein n=1 Tax=Bacillus mesophilum TaxID=1071718 RepID=A0A7V7UWK1_9BACI|nr:phage tail domain-containing protein [Bacillus mesophilum]KAB2334255.1 phage tail family protein [Bacillus mesophilum]
MIIFENLNGHTVDLKAAGIYPLRLTVDSLTPRISTEIVEGMDGHIDLETTYEGRTMSASFFVESKYGVDYYQLRNLVYNLFNGKSYFYIIDENDPSKRWKVKTSERYTVEKLSWIAGNFTVNLVSPSPYAESVSMPHYQFKDKFSFYNNGDVVIDMRTQQDTEIEFRGVSEGLTISNQTTGDTWSYDGSTTADDVILLKGIRSTKNGTSIFGNTNKKLLTFAPQWNSVHITGSTDFTLVFKTRFYFI